MAQTKVWGWTNPAAAVARNEDVGFTVDEITVTDVTNGNQWYWNSSMTSGYYVLVSTGAVTTSNGFTPLSQSTSVGASISGITNANPGVLTVDETSKYGFATGDTIKVVAVADDGTSTTLNGTYTIASTTATTITTATNTTAYSAYVSGGYVVRVSDSSGTPIPIENEAITGITLGTGCVGANNAVMVAVAHGSNSVT